MRSHKIKKFFNIIFSVILVFSILSSTFGVCALAITRTKALETVNPDDTTEAVNTVNNNLNIPETPDFDSHKNTAVANDNVVFYTQQNSKAITDSLVSAEVAYNGDYNDDDSIVLTFNRSFEELFGNLSAGDLFFIDGQGSQTLNGQYFFKLSYFSSYGDQSTVYVTQPGLDEVFQSLDIGFNDFLTEENLVSATTLPGVSMHFGDIKSEITNVSYEKDFDTGMNNLNSTNTPTPAPLKAANDYSIDPLDLIIEFGHSDKDDKDDKDDDNKFTIGGMEFSGDKELEIAGKLGIEDLSVYAVCDMPSPFKFQELMFGVRGKLFAGITFHGKFDASFHPEETKWERDGKFVDIEISGLNKKWLPIGIWQFQGTTLIPVTSNSLESTSIVPKFYFMLYMDAEGNFEFGFEFNFGYEKTFNNGISIIKDGETNFSFMSYPYSGNDDIIPPGEGGLTWDLTGTLDLNADVTIIGASVQFYIAGINIGEIELINLGCDGQLSAEISGGKDKPLKIDTDETNAYFRWYLKLIEANVKINGEISAFKHDLEVNLDQSFQLIDITLCSTGDPPSNRRKKIPVSSQWVPTEFDTIFCIVGDVSGSMDERMSSSEGTKLDALKEACHKINDVVKNSITNDSGHKGLALVQFSDSAKTIAIPHTDYDYIDACIDYLDIIGGTNISSGLSVAIDQLSDTEAEQKIILLMTDGQDSSHSDIIEQANRAKNEGIKVYTIGFGQGADEELLQEIADTADGEYRYASTEGMVELMGSFLYTYESSQGDVLLDVQDTVREGEVVTAKSFKVPDKFGSLNANLYWPGSTLDLILVDPNGRKVDETYPGAKIIIDDTLATITISSPLPGNWDFKVKGIETSYEEEPFYAIAAFQESNRSKTATNPQLETIQIVSAYCIPIGLFLTFVSAYMLIAINKKGKQ